MIDMHIYRERGGLALNIAPMKYCSVWWCVAVCCGVGFLSTPQPPIGGDSESHSCITNRQYSRIFHQSSLTLFPHNSVVSSMEIIVARHRFTKATTAHRGVVSQH